MKRLVVGIVVLATGGWLVTQTILKGIHPTLYVREATHVKSGPSDAAESLGILRAGESVRIVEKDQTDRWGGIDSALLCSGSRCPDIGWVYLPHLSHEPYTTKAYAPRICRAAIAAIMARDPAMIRADVATGGYVSLHYRSPSHDSRWSYKCKIEGNRVLWGKLGGRWRDHFDDAVVTFHRGSNPTDIVIRQQYSDGSTGKDLIEIP